LKGGVAPATAASEQAPTRPIHNDPVPAVTRLPLTKEATQEAESKLEEVTAVPAKSVTSGKPAPIAADSTLAQIAAPLVAASPPPATPVKTVAAPPSDPTPATPAATATGPAEDPPKDMVSTMELVLQQPKKKHTWGAWKLIAPALLMLLGIQIVHYFRQDIASHPKVGPALIALYGSLGVELAPHWQLQDYEVRQLGVLANPGTPGTLKVRASITNRADFPQPYPLLRLVLEDRFGQLVQAREFEPSEYADRKFDRNARLSPNQRIDANLTIVDPGTQAEGFRFDVCLRQVKGVFCADDQAPVL
jgi:hypothetical protein